MYRYVHTTAHIWRPESNALSADSITSAFFDLTSHLPDPVSIICININ